MYDNAVFRPERRLSLVRFVSFDIVQQRASARHFAISR
jgi:hypothetical protein